MVAVTFSIPSNILLPSPLKAFIYEHSRQKVAAVAVEKKLYTLIPQHYYKIFFLST